MPQTWLCARDAGVCMEAMLSSMDAGLGGRGRWIIVCFSHWRVKLLISVQTLSCYSSSHRLVGVGKDLIIIQFQFPQVITSVKAVGVRGNVDE